MKFRFSLLLLVIPLAACSSAKPPVLQVPFQADYATFARVLKTMVYSDRVDYSTLKAKRSGLDSAVAQFASVTPEALGLMTRDEQMAFWINAYNAITLRSVIDAYPVKSIKDIDGVWDKKRWVVGGRKVTLNEIEHSILRPEFKDPRVHFAINCASVGCPPLADHPYAGSRLNDQLDSAAAGFVNNPARNHIDAASGVIRTSELFQWFGEDFVPGYGNDKFPYLSPVEAAILQFMLRYADEERTAVLTSGKHWKFEYPPYDWQLNDYKPH